MRLWTLHPKYLDRQGLLALWREALLAQAVLRGGTAGYRHHPQLCRFRISPRPGAAVAAYLREVHAEAVRRGYRFDAGKIPPAEPAVRLAETRGQLLHEWGHLLAKLERRSPEAFRHLSGIACPEAHPLFRVVPGPVREWEKSGRTAGSSGAGEPPGPARPR